MLCSALLFPTSTQVWDTCGASGLPWEDCRDRFSRWLCKRIGHREPIQRCWWWMHATVTVASSVHCGSTTAPLDRRQACTCWRSWQKTPCAVLDARPAERCESNYGRLWNQVRRSFRNWRCASASWSHRSRNALVHIFSGHVFANFGEWMPKCCPCCLSDNRF